MKAQRLINVMSLISSLCVYIIHLSIPFELSPRDTNIAVTYNRMFHVHDEQH